MSCPGGGMYCGVCGGVCSTDDGAPPDDFEDDEPLFDEQDELERRENFETWEERK